MKALADNQLNAALMTEFVLDRVENTLYQTTNFWTGPKLKAFADDNKNVTRKENFYGMGKGENVGYQHFLLFPHCFQKASFTGSLKVMIV